MGFVKNLFSGSSGMGYQASGTNLNQAFNMDQMGQLNQLALTGVNDQQAFARAVQGYVPQALDQQRDLGMMLMNQATGQGVNPAMAQYQQNLNQIAAQQAGATASQKGISPALAARLISQQAGATRQNAAAQAAQLQAEQQMAAMSALGNLSSQQVNQGQAALNSFNSAAQGAQGNMMGAIGNYNNNAAGMQGSINSANAGIQSQVAQQQGNLFSNIMDKGGKALALAHGGEIPNHDGPASAFCRAMKSGGMVNGAAKVAGDSYENDVVPAMLSPKEIVLPRSVTMADDAPERAAKFVAAIKARKMG